MSKSIMKFETSSFTAEDKIKMINLCYHIPVKYTNAILWIVQYAFNRNLNYSNGNHLK